jgi:ankyrin repeat protein
MTARGFAGFALILAVSAPASAESDLYWALGNNDPLVVWQLTADGGLPANDADAELDRPYLAVSAGSAEALDALAWKGVALDAVNDQGRNLLFPAAAVGRLDLFDRIQAAGAKIDQVDNQGRTLVHMAALSPHPEMLKTLLSLGLGPQDTSSLGMTPLMEACLAGKADEAAVLLAWGAIPEDEDWLGRTVRDYAAASGDAATLTVIDEALSPWSISQDGEAPPP